MSFMVQNLRWTRSSRIALQIFYYDIEHNVNYHSFNAVKVHHFNIPSGASNWYWFLMLTIKFSIVSKLKMSLPWLLTTWKDSWVNFAVQCSICCPIVVEFFSQDEQVSSPLSTPVKKSMCEIYHVVVLIFSTASILILFFIMIFEYI